MNDKENCCKDKRILNAKNQDRKINQIGAPTYKYDNLGWTNQIWMR